MAWRSSGATNAELVANLRAADILSGSGAAFDAMLATDRAYYAPNDPYQDAPQPIGHRATISAPHMHAHALDLLEGHLQPGAHALDVGCGSGYLTACMARMVGFDGGVTAVDYVPDLVALAEANLRADDAQLLDSGLVDLKQGDGWLGDAAGAPFDCIHVGAAAASVPPALVEQLRVGGRMIIPVGPDGGDQRLLQVDKLADGTAEERELMGVRYVPLVKGA